jgi:aspartate ammonia-lyase
MSLLLPPLNSPLRDLFEVSMLADYMKLPNFRQALTDARAYMKAEKAVRSVYVLCIRANGDIELLRVGPRGGWKPLFNFGNPISN